MRQSHMADKPTRSRGSTLFPEGVIGSVHYTPPGRSLFCEAHHFPQAGRGLRSSRIRWTEGISLGREHPDTAPARTIAVAGVPAQARRAFWRRARAGEARAISIGS